MAQRKPVVTKVEDCACESCIYSLDLETVTYCYHTEANQNECDWCEEGLWVVTDADDDVFCASLAAIYAIEAEKAKGRSDDDDEEEGIDIDLVKTYLNVRDALEDIEDRLSEIESKTGSIPLPRRKAIDTQK